MSSFFVLATLAFCGCGREQTLTVWTTTDTPPALAEFEKTTGRPVRVERVPAAELAARLATESATCDLVLLDSFVIPELIERRLLRPLNHDLLPHMAQNFDRALRPCVYDGSFNYTVPLSIAFIGLWVNADSASPAASWADLGTPERRGRVALAADGRINYAAAKLSLGGYDAEDAAARERLAQWEANRAADGAAADVAIGRSSEAPGAAWRFVPPTEGVICVGMEMAVPAGASHPELAHQRIDFIYTPANAVRMDAPPQNMARRVAIASVEGTLLAPAKRQKGRTR